MLDANHDALAKRSSQLRNDNELSLVFLTDRELARLHGDFLADPTETDVITFEGDSALGFAGEVCVSVDAALRHVARLRRPKSRGNPAVSPAAFSGELLLYVVHGWLHLAGHDDLKPEKKRVMRRAERRAMSLLEAAGCVDVFELK